MMIAHVSFPAPKKTDILNGSFLEYLDDHLENAMGGFAGVAFSAGKIHVSWPFDAEDNGINTEMLRLLSGVVDFLVDQSCFEIGMQFSSSVEWDVDN